jgi:hypothetical protein
MHSFVDYVREVIPPFNQEGDYSVTERETGEKAKSDVKQSSI